MLHQEPFRLRASECAAIAYEQVRKRHWKLGVFRRSLSGYDIRSDWWTYIPAKWRNEKLRRLLLVFSDGPILS